MFILVIHTSNCRFWAKVGGIPFPKVIWLKGGIELAVDANTKRFHFCQQLDGYVGLYIENCSLYDNGNYSLLVKNDGGVDRCSFDLVVEHASKCRSLFLSSWNVAAIHSHQILLRLNVQTCFFPVSFS